MTATTETLPRRRHHGRNIKTLREMLGIKQDALAIDLNVSQQSISSMESREQLDDELIGKVAVALGVKPELIKNFVPEEAIYNIQNNYEGSNPGAASVYSVNDTHGTQNLSCTFNPLDKYVEAVEENKKLYERLLQAEQDKVQLLTQMLKEKE